jgi:hypothetical protein
MTASALRILFALLPAVLAFADPARGQPCVTNVPHLDGQWVTLPYSAPLNPISATLLRDGTVLIVAGSENDEDNYGGLNTHSYRWARWDPTGTTQSSFAVGLIPYDVFCSGTAQLPDGRALVVGGTSSYAFTGESRSSIFDPVTGKFVQSQSMADGRWYATATTLGDGRVMAFSGILSAGGTNRTVEIYDLATAGSGWTSPTTNAPFVPPLYPNMFLLPSGKVFFTGQGGGTRTTNGWTFDPTTRAWTISAATTRNRNYGTSVLLPLLAPSYTPRVMAFGGGNPATSTTEIIDLSATTPSWTPGPSMSTGRIELNATILPDRRVLVQGGSLDNEEPDDPSKRADLLNTAATAFASAGTAAYSRLYHSSALLLPDATVMMMGSNPSPRSTYEPAIEIYTPAYLFDANDQPIGTARPALTDAPAVVGYDADFSAAYTSTSAISSAVLIRPGSTTHTFDMDQRLVGLCGPSPQPACAGAAGTLTLRSPPNGRIAPPGYYMLFILDAAGVPSKARFIQLSPYAGPPPDGAITTPASDVTISAGGSVSFGTTSTATQYSWVFPGGSPGTSVAKNPGSVVFNTRGTYVASLTLIDAAGNSDPSPATRTITVNPSSSDFEIDVTPSQRAVLPGQSASFTVIVRPLSGFNGSVNLSVSSEAGFPVGVTSGGFSPASISGSGTSTLTMNTGAAATPYALSLTIAGTTASLTRKASTTLVVGLAAPASLTATPGNGQVQLSWPAALNATSYHVKRATTSGGPYVLAGCASGTSFTDSGRTNGTTYYYVVSSAFTGSPNGGGESANSAETSATPQSPTTTTVVATTSTTTTTTIPPPPGTLVNGGFELDEVGWSGWTDSANASEALVTTVEPCAGTRSLLMKDSSTRTRAVRQDVVIQPGVPLRLQLLARGINLGTNQGRPILEWRNGTTVLSSTTLTLPPGTYACSPFTLDTTPPAGATSVRVRLTLGPVTDGVPSNHAQVMYDDVALGPIGPTTTTTTSTTTSSTTQPTTTSTTTTSTTTPPTTTTSTIPTSTTTTTTTSTTIPSPPPNLLANGGFEQGQTGWSGWTDSQNASEAIVTTTGPCAGTQSLQMSDSSTRTRAINQEVAIQAGVPLRLQLLARGTNLGTNQGRPMLEWRIGTTVLGTTTLTLPPGTYACTPFTLDATPPAGATSVRVRLTLGPVTDGVPTNHAQVMYDDVVLGLIGGPTSTTTSTTATTTTTTVPAGSLANGGFEQGQTGWSGWTDSQNASEALVTTVGPCAGTQSLQMKDSSTRTRAVYQDLAIQPGTPLRLQLLARASNLGTNQGRPILEWRSGTTVVSTSTLTLPPGTYACTPFTLDATPPGGATSVRVRLTLGPATTGVPFNGGEVWYDDVTLGAAP